MDNPIAEILTAADGYALEPPIEPLELPGQGTNNTTVAFFSSSRRYIWRRYQTHARADTIEYEHALLDWLGQQRLPFATPAPLAMRNGKTLHQADDGIFALFPLVLGVEPDRRDPVMMEAVGEALSELHRALESYPKAARPGLGTYAQIVEVHPHLPKPGQMRPEDVGIEQVDDEVDALFAWWRDEIHAVEQWKAANYHELPRQVIHGDFTPGNTLALDNVFSGKQVSAILDFDFALVDARAIDVAAGLYFTMRMWDNPDPWPVAQAFCRGYGRRVQLTDAEIAAIPWLMRLRSVVSTVWWFGKEAAAGKAVRLWRIEDLQDLVTWLEANEESLAGIIRA